MSLAITDRVSLTVKQAAEATGLSQDEIRAAYRSGDLPCRYKGSRVLIRRQDLEAFIDDLPTERATA